MLLTALLTLIAAPACQAPEASPTSPAPAQAGAEQEFSWEPDLSGAVALSGSTLAIGAPLAGQGGTVTIYRSGPGGWEELARLAPEGDAEGEGFGAAVALSGDTLAVGAPLADEGAGTFYVYERSEDGWHQVLRFVRDVWYDGLVVEGLPHTGAAVALHGDRLVVGSPGTGQVEAFVRSAEGAWLSMAYLSAEPLDAEQGELFLPNPRDAFGASVAIWNDTIAVGAPTAQVNGVTAGMVSLFTRERVDPAAPDVDRGWKRDWFMTSDDAEEGDRFGASVSLCGRRLAVGAPREDQRALDAGAAYVFARAGGEWKQEAKLMASDGVRDAGFGNVELLGTLLAVGAPGQRPLEQDETAVTERSGEVYLFGYAPEPGVGTGPRRWTERAHFGGDEGDTSFGDALAVSGLDVAVRSAQTPAHLTDAAEHYLSGAARSSVADVVREVVTDGSWATVEQHPAFAPEIGVLTPVVQGLVDGSDLPSIVMPPPCTVRFTVRPEDGPIVLRAAAGLDHTFLPRRLPGLELIRIGYEVLVDDELVFEAEIEPLFKGEYDHRRWRRLIDPEERPEGLALGGLPLVPGSVVTLRTKVTHPEVAVEELPRIPAGFGEVELVRRSAREPQPATRERPNIVLIVMDTLRADALSCYRDDATASVAGAPPTPFLAALARRGVLFENAYAASSWTWPSTASLLTGLWPEEHGVVSDESCYLTGELDTLPEVLAANGYATGAFSCNPLIVPDKNFDQGFEYFDRPLSRGFRNSHEIRADVEAWIGAHADERFFLYLHLADTHFPYEPTPEAEADVPGSAPESYPETGLVSYHRELLAGAGRDPDGTLHLERVVPPDHLAWMRRAYEQSVASADDYVGAVVRWIDTLGLSGRTLIAFTSDHGEELCQRELATHGQSVHPELVRAPLIVVGPGVPSGVRVERAVSNRHLAPTLAKVGGGELAGLLDPVDLLGELPTRTVFVSTEHGSWNGRSMLTVNGLRTRRWSLHHAPAGAPFGAGEEPDPSGPGELRLYDLAADPDETTDVAARHPEIVEVLFAELVRHLEGAQASAVASPVKAGGATLQMLKAIGYIGDEDE